MMREVTSPDHSLGLFVALAVPSDTPHFRVEQELWVPYEDLLFAPTNYDDNSTDASHTAPHSVMVTTLQAELDKIPFQSGFVNESLKSRSFLWRRREDYILAILHNALLSLISSKVVTLPPASESDVCEWLPRLVSCVATEIARQHKNPVAVVQAACTAVTNCRLAAFAATSIARAVPSAQRHQQLWAECVPCGRYWPVDVFVTHGSEVRCKMCFDKKALHFLASSKAEKRKADCLDYVSTVQHFGHLIDRSISDALMATVTLVKAEAEYTAKFHCPMNPLHQTPFIVEIPENEQNGGGNAPVGIRCSECQVLWCSQCSYVHHPNAASCGEVSSVKRQCIANQ